MQIKWVWIQNTNFASHFKRTNVIGKNAAVWVLSRKNNMHTWTFERIDWQWSSRNIYLQRSHCLLCTWIADICDWFSWSNEFEMLNKADCLSFGDEGGKATVKCFFHVSFATTSVWFLLSQSERNKWLPLRNASASTKGDIPYLLTSFTYCNTYARIESTHYSERKTNQARSWMRKKCHAADNKPHTILFKHWNGRVTMKKTCEFGRK